MTDFPVYAGIDVAGSLVNFQTTYLVIKGPPLH